MGTALLSHIGGMNMPKFECKCGNKRFFYNEISVMAKKLIDQNKGTRNGKVFGIEKEIEDNFFAPIYCNSCGEKVSEN
jgi:predicted nucleic-acid-binding Zn-ribbon protein